MKKLQQILRTMLVGILGLFMMLSFIVSISASEIEMAIRQLDYEELQFRSSVLDQNYEVWPTSLSEFNVPDVEYTYEMFELVNKIMEMWNVPHLDNYVTIVPHFISYTAYQRLATVFNVHDGILNPNTHWNHIRNLGVDARNHAQERYPVLTSNYWNCPNRMSRDRFRHFTWNFRLAGATNLNTARISTNNFEYATLLLPTWQAHFNDFMAQRPPSINITQWTASAQASADRHAINERTRLANVASMSNANFTREFGPNNIMDFWNNWAGYSFAGATNNRAQAQNAFYNAVGRGIIILDETNSQVTNARVTELRNSGVWRHFQ